MLTKSKAISAKTSPTNLTALHFKYPPSSFPLTTTNTHAKEIQTPQHPISIQESFVPDYKKLPPNDQDTHTIKIPETLQPSNTFVGLLDRHTFYSTDFSLFDPKVFHRKSLTETAYLNSLAPQKTQTHDTETFEESKELKTDTSEISIKPDPQLKSLADYKISNNSSKSSKSQSTLRSKKFECISRDGLVSRINRPVTTKHVSNKSLIMPPSSNDGFRSVKNAIYTEKPSPKNEAFLTNSFLQENKKLYRSSNKKLSLKESVLENMELSLSKLTPTSKGTLNKAEMKTPSHHAKNSIDASLTEKLNKSTRNSENGVTWRFALDNYKRLGKSPAEEINAKQNQALVTKGPLKSQIKKKRLVVSESGAQSFFGKTDIQFIPKDLLGESSHHEDMISLNTTEKIIQEEDGDVSKSKNNNNTNLMQIDSIQSYTSIEEPDREETEQTSIAQSSFMLGNIEDDAVTFFNYRTEQEQRDEKEFEEFFSSSVSYMCEVIDGKEVKLENEPDKSQEDHLTFLLDSIVRRIYILKKDREGISERAIMGKRLLILLDMSLRSMICLIRRKETAVRRFYNKSCGGKINEKKITSGGQDLKVKFEEVCGIEGEEEIFERNERDVRDRLCQEIQKRREELGDLEKVLKEAKQNKTLQYIKSVNMKVCNLLKTKTKTFAK